MTQIKHKIKNKTKQKKGKNGIKKNRHENGLEI